MEQLVNLIIRPPRAEYNPQDDLLDHRFKLKGKLYRRKDLEVVNDRGDVLQCSHYMPIICPEENLLPCVIYCHGNSGCRSDASEAVVILLPSNITVFAFDFSGSGLSGGEHVTLGWNEKADLRAVVEYLRTEGTVSLIGLWGRSMGAVTSLLYAAEDPSIAGIVIDSPFSDLIDLMMELVDGYKFRLPKFTVKFLIQYVRRTILKKAKFDIMDLNTIKAAKSCFVPALFGHANDDDFIRPHHSDLIFKDYAGDKNSIRFEGDHNSPRPEFYFDSISIFFNNVLQPPMDEPRPVYFGPWGALRDLASSDHMQEQSDGAAANNATNNTMEQLRAAANDTIDNTMEQLHSKQPVDNHGPDLSPSSSTIVRFESAKSSPHHFDCLVDIPSNIEDEERMIMEALFKSLKDIERQYPRVKEPSLNDCSSTSSDHSDNRLKNLTGGKEDETSVSTSDSNMNVPSDNQRSSSHPTVASEAANDNQVGDSLACCWDLRFFRNR